MDIADTVRPPDARRVGFGRRPGRHVARLREDQRPGRVERTAEQVGHLDLDIGSSVVDGRTVVQVVGEIDVYTAPQLRERLDQEIEAGRHDLVVDLSGVSFMDSTGLGVLVGRLKQIRLNDGSMRLVCAHDRVLKVFVITGLDKVFAIYPDGRRGRRRRLGVADLSAVRAGVPGPGSAHSGLIRASTYLQVGFPGESPARSCCAHFWGLNTGPSTRG